MNPTMTIITPEAMELHPFICQFCHGNKYAIFGDSVKKEMYGFCLGCNNDQLRKFLGVMGSEIK